MIKIIYILFLSTLTISVFGQTKIIEINEIPFSFVDLRLDSLDGVVNKVVELYRGNKKLLSHTLLQREGDCSSIHIQLGNYKVRENEIIFYSYWAATDRMPTSILPFGFMKQIYSVDSFGLVKLKDSKIYIETYVESKNKNYYENNGWRHKGLKYLNEPVKNKNDQKLLDDYIKSIESEFNADFVLNKKKESLEKEVRLSLNTEIKKNTKNWIEGEVYGRVKK